MGEWITELEMLRKENKELKEKFDIYEDLLHAIRAEIQVSEKDERDILIKIETEITDALEGKEVDK